MRMEFMKRFLLASLCFSACSAAAFADEAGAQDKPRSLEEKFDDLLKTLPFGLHGGAYLWHYQPNLPGSKPDSSLYYAWLAFDAKADDFGFYFEPHFRDSKLRPFFNSDFWVQEIYASWTVPYSLGTLKAGKTYSRLGRFWDGSFYGNLPYFDGLKLDPDIGFSLENTAKAGDGLSIEYSAQYFTNDGRTNGSLADAAMTQPRDTIGDGSASIFDQPERLLEGELPNPIDLPRGCRFAGRCPFRFDRCAEEEPELKEVETGHTVACYLYE